MSKFNDIKDTVSNLLITKSAITGDIGEPHGGAKALFVNYIVKGKKGRIQDKLYRSQELLLGQGAITGNNIPLLIHTVDRYIRWHVREKRDHI